MVKVKCIVFDSHCSLLLPKILAKFQRGHPQRGRQLEMGKVQVGNFRQVSHYISETVKASDIVTTER